MKKANLETVTAKFNSGKILSKNDCSVVISAIYTDFTESHGETVRTDLLDILITNAQKVVEKNGRPLSDNEAKEFYGLSFCSNHTAKMAGMESVSTNNKINKRCARNKKCNGSICQFCFADRQIDTFTSMNKPLTINYLLLNYRVLPVEILPIVNRLYARIESFGDVETAIQAINYCNICTAHEVNKMCNFGAWSKNPDIWRAAFVMRGKPENLSFGVSSLFMGKIQKIPPKYAPFVDFVFTVFETEEDARRAGYEINCGARHCLSCLRCYNARKADGLVYVIELKK